jgi:hypothetical protein
LGDRSARFTRHSPGDRWFVDETYVKVTPAEMVTNAAPVYRSAWHHVERHANNPIEADHSQLKHRVRADPARPGIGRSTVTAVPGGWHDHGMDVARRTIVALDFDDAEKAMAIVDRLGDAGRSFKIGLELLTAAGPATVTRLVDAGKDVFLDLKLFEIPPSVAGAVRVAGRLGATMVTVHAMGGPAIMDAAVRDGATHVIVGRSVTRAPDPAAVLTHLHSQLANR